MNKNGLLLCIVIALTACSHQPKQTEQNLKDYYFQYKELVAPKLYCYVNQNDTTEKAYWEMQTQIHKGDTLLLTTILDTHKQKNEVLTERLSNLGSDMIQYTLFNKQDSVECRIIGSKVFNWNMSLNERISWQIAFPEFSSKQMIELTKDRTLTGIDTVNHIITFRDKMSMLLKATGQKHTYEIETQYKKGIGLITYKITSPNRPVKDFRLKNH